ncbi:MAG: hypothetical protein IPF54_15260 [Draconibacterium sp.]|nr:hypothetical protein [Draconibacterium sp.]
MITFRVIPGRIKLESGHVITIPFLTPKTLECVASVTIPFVGLIFSGK